MPAPAPAPWWRCRTRRETPRAPPQDAPAAGAEPCLEVVPVPGKGLGTRALRAIRPGELVLEEEPLFRVEFPGSVESDEEYTECVRAAAEALSADAREDLLALACVTPEPSPEGAFQANHFEVDGACVVYRRISRLNHSCSPNCAHSFDRQRQVGMIRTLREVAVGEELSLTYTELRAPREARRGYLQQVYGFVCACEACSQGGTRSDQRRELLRCCCDALVPNGPVVQMYGWAGRVAECEDSYVKRKALEQALEARALGLRLAVLALRLQVEEALAGAGDATGHACEAAVFLLAGHADAQALWASACLFFVSLGGSPTDAAAMEAGLNNIRELRPLLPELPADTEPEALDPRKIEHRRGEAAEAQTLDEAHSSLQRLNELFDHSVAANAPG